MRPPYPVTLSLSIGIEALLQSVWQDAPLERPSFRNIIQTLDASREKTRRLTSTMSSPHIMVSDADSSSFLSSTRHVQTATSADNLSLLVFSIILLRYLILCLLQGLTTVALMKLQWPLLWTLRRQAQGTQPGPMMILWGLP